MLTLIKFFKIWIRNNIFLKLKYIIIDLTLGKDSMLVLLTLVEDRIEYLHKYVVTEKTADYYNIYKDIDQLMYVKSILLRGRWKIPNKILMVEIE